MNMQKAPAEKEPFQSEHAKSVCGKTGMENTQKALAEKARFF
jgi:hypothetical protein